MIKVNLKKMIAGFAGPSVFLTAVLLALSLFAAVPARAATIKCSAKTLSTSSIKISCSCGKGVTYWKIRQGVEKKSGGHTAYKTIKTLKKSKKSYTIKKLKKNTHYFYELVGCVKKNGKLKSVIYDYQEAFTGMSDVVWDAYAASDAYCSPERIDLMGGCYNNGFAIKGYEIYRKKKGESKYTKLATISKKSAFVYKDKKVEAGATYRYRFRSYGTISKKKAYSPWSDVLTRSAVNQTGSFSSQFISQSREELVIKLNSKLYNGDLMINNRSFALCTQQQPDDGNVDDLDEGTGIYVHAVSYSKDGTNWTPIGEKDEIALKGGESLYLTFKGKEDKDLSKAYWKEGYLEDEGVTYNRLPCNFHLSLNGKGSAAMNGEMIH